MIVSCCMAELCSICPSLAPMLNPGPMESQGCWARAVNVLGGYMGILQLPLTPDWSLGYSCCEGISGCCLMIGIVLL